MIPEDSQIIQFFKNQTIFLTGATGFLGKLLIEKLLRVCWDLNKIYVLVRPKKGKTAEERFEELFDNACFDLIKNKNLKEKVFLINGDCEKPSLGLTSQDINILKMETTCIFHGAANVKFDQSLKEASHIVTALKELLDLAKETPNLKVFVYISTAYSNCIHSHIKEEFYEPPMRPETLLHLVNSLDDVTLKRITPFFLGKWPNTYVFAKSISEALVRNAKLEAPVAVVRPAIVTNTLGEPVEGWIDNRYGFVGMCLGTLVGVMRSLHARMNNRQYLVPVDYVSNCTLAVAWKAAQEISKSPFIYNCKGQMIPLELAVKIMQSFYWEFPSIRYLWYMSFAVRGKFLHYIYIRFYTAVAYLVDAVLLCLGRSAIAAGRFKYLNDSLDLQSYFCTHDWTIDDDNVVNLWNEMCDVDKHHFKFNIRFDWYKYLRNCALGIRLYLLKDPLRTLESGRKRLRILFVLHYTVVALLLCFIYFIVKFLWFLLIES